MLIAQFEGFSSLILNSGWVAQLVLLTLLVFSVLSWTIIFRKLSLFRHARAQSAAFYERFHHSRSLTEIYRECERFPSSPLAGIFKVAFRELNQQLPSGEASDEAQVVSLTGVERVLRKTAVAEMTELERQLNWLATTGSVTPFIGLFGTVIGIINAFQGLGQGATTTIQAVAPGISEALVATAAGLFAAIPAVIAYNHFVHDLKVFAAEMEDFSIELLNLLERSFT